MFNSVYFKYVFDVIYYEGLCDDTLRCTVKHCNSLSWVEKSVTTHTGLLRSIKYTVSQYNVDVDIPPRKLCNQGGNTGRQLLMI